MKVIKSNGTVVNLDKYERVEVKQAFGILGKLTELENHVVIASLTISGFLGNNIESQVLGIYETEKEAKNVQDMLIKAWCANNEKFIMPEDAKKLKFR
ncbi:hypothetical protein NPD5_3859 [Clostridium sporogenes]|uniref:Uncharacterized protein n=1 Tax=Clostridium sporogenes TaxID=1509 RepID=A0A1L3NBX9_CLOSG|nr:hypothetical protein [Clostridium sporogenes]APH13609.1 hypothetical protein NPD5_3859 [Clostridium sporogenes]